MWELGVCGLQRRPDWDGIVFGSGVMGLTGWAPIVIIERIILASVYFKSKWMSFSQWIL